MRHSASLTELGRHGEWPRVRQELISTQTDVEQAIVELRDEKMAHLISLGGWLRGLEFCARVVEMDFSAQRAKILAQPDLADYFPNELQTPSPPLARTALFEKIRGAPAFVKQIPKHVDACRRKRDPDTRKRAQRHDSSGSIIAAQPPPRQALCCGMVTLPVCR